MAPDLCGSEEHCIEPCPTTAIRMEWVKAKGNMQVGRWL
jgi:Na+-translocating ferredoxin:NAD+ oxidoreductase RNF subunit RnfB